jgi:hypothetical protein
MALCIRCQTGLPQVTKCFRCEAVNGVAHTTPDRERYKQFTPCVGEETGTNKT